MLKRAAGSEIVRALLVLVILVAARGLHAVGWSSGGSDVVMRTLANRDLNKEAREALTAGYYEGLLNEGSRVSGMNRLITGSRRITFEDRSQPDRRETHDFRFYELIPNSEIPDYRDSRFRYNLRTNSAGLADREYTLAKTQGTWRLALLGDSITRGQGAPFLENYESLLEQKLNERDVAGDIKSIEILNFAVGSYNVTQMFDTAVVKAAPYRPDVYVVGMSKLSVYRSWGQHIALLMNAGIDLKYDYLRGLVREAGLRADDPVGVTSAKLARFRIPTIRWVLTELKKHASSQGAEVVVLLLPTVEGVDVLDEEFLGVRQLVESLGIPVIDLVDTFAAVDQRQYRVADNDFHPNAAGHHLLFERMYQAISNDPQLRHAFSGQRASAARR